MTTLANFHHTSLVRHARNMRRKYHLADVRRMALSQAERAKRGLPPCVQPIIVTPGPGQNYHPKQHPQLIIVAGHLRHAGNAYLKHAAPALNCIIRYYPDEQSMLADMSHENGVRAELSPLEWAHHFQNRLEDSSVDIHRLARESGKSLYAIQQHLALLKLAPRAQAVFDDGALPLTAVSELLKISDPVAQSKTARQLGQSRAGGKAIRTKVQAVLSLLESKPRPGQRRAPRRPATDKLPPQHSATLADIRQQAAEVCAVCDIGSTLPLKEPAWHIALKAAGETCDSCGLQNIRGACNGCPLAETLSRVARQLNNELKPIAQPLAQQLARVA